MQALMDETKIKQLMKEAFAEALQEQRDILHDLVVEAIEDIALANAIREGASSPSVSKEEIYGILKG
jgi:hypothetical protein